MQIKHTITLVSIFATLLFATACGQHEEETTTDETTTETAPEADEEAADEAPAADQPAAEPAQADQPAEAAGDNSACGRAQTCCEGYVGEMNAMAAGSVSVDTACSGIAAARNTPGGAGDATCNQIITTFRTTLENAHRTVPAACAAN